MTEGENNHNSCLFYELFITKNICVNLRHLRINQWIIIQSYDRPDLY